MNSGFVPRSSLQEAGCRRTVLDQCSCINARRQRPARRTTAGTCLNAGAHMSALSPQARLQSGYSRESTTGARPPSKSRVRSPSCGTQGCPSCATFFHCASHPEQACRDGRAPRRVASSVDVLRAPQVSTHGAQVTSFKIEVHSVAGSPRQPLATAAFSAVYCTVVRSAGMKGMRCFQAVKILVPIRGRPLSAVETRRQPGSVKYTVGCQTGPCYQCP
jgi:hypothetical protein